ncbi:LAME_0F11122g1_1 [Lachancea meyersii CBS 8951]|uniref:LAME_0F11122g1_1 n=1 Tax=Lachancea meyersii CBS 8951 TaxID=1266667 RepID=A0A1G4JVZ2_9SACH|nr:LAME_0F11122g1_1 [Lachancea meyersii CBS 8951]
MEIFIDRVEKPVTFGIDLYSFEVQPGQVFHGFKNIPREPQVHVVHFQHSADGMRYGYYVESQSTKYLQFDYSAAQELFVPRALESAQDKTDAYNKFRELNPLMVPYPSIDEGDSWQALTNFIKMLDVRYIAGSSEQCVYMDSVITTEEEEGILSRALAKNRGTAHDTGSTRQTPALNYTSIVFKSKDALRDDFKMQDFFDKSYYLNDVILPRYHHNSIFSLFGELQCAFLNAMMFGNYGSSLQWHNIVELIASSSAVSEPAILQLDSILAQQFGLIPEFYADTLLNEEAWVRILGSSHHGSALSRTRCAVCKLWPHLDENDANVGDDIYDVDDIHDVDDAQNDDDDDDDGPVVVEQVIYRPRATH